MAIAEETRSLSHRGELRFSFKLNGLPDMSFGHYVTATAVAPDGCFIALGDHGGDVYIVQRPKPEAESFKLNWIVRTGISYPSLMAVSKDAECLMVLDSDSCIHFYNRYINEWVPDRVHVRGLHALQHVVRLINAVFAKDVLSISFKEKVEYSFRRRKRIFRRGYKWVRS